MVTSYLFASAWLAGANCDAPAAKRRAVRTPCVTASEIPLEILFMGRPLHSCVSLSRFCSLGRLSRSVKAGFPMRGTRLPKSSLNLTKLLPLVVGERCLFAWDFARLTLKRALRIFLENFEVILFPGFRLPH